MKYSIKLFLCVGLVTSLTACGQPSASSNKDLTKADKDELSTFYQIRRKTPHFRAEI